MHERLFGAAGVDQSPSALSPCKGRIGIYRHRALSKRDRLPVVLVDSRRPVGESGKGLGILRIDLNRETSKAGRLPQSLLWGRPSLHMSAGPAVSSKDHRSNKAWVERQRLFEKLQCLVRPFPCPGIERCHGAQV